MVVETTIKLNSELVTETVTLSPEATQGKVRVKMETREDSGQILHIMP